MDVKVLRDKLVRILTSRKFWASVLGVLVAIGLLDLDDPEQLELAATITAGIAGIYAIATAIEDGFRRNR